MRRRLCLLVVLLVATCLRSTAIHAAEPVAPQPEPVKGATNTDLFRRDNLIAWCIVPFDAKKRQPEARAAMLEKLGFKHFAYDYRAEHVPTFEAEIEACKRHGVSLDAWWFPSSLNDEARQILDVCKRQGISPQLWISGGGAATESPEEQQRRIEQEAARIKPIVEAAAAQGMQVGLYNHGGWFGEPENQLAIIKHLNLPNVGMVYNQHHGHEHLDRFAKVLPQMLPHLLTLNLNGMNPEGDRKGQKILQLGQGELDLELLRVIASSGYRGPIGILGHTQDDAEARLQDNLDGLDWLLPQLAGQPAGARPKPRTPAPGSKPAAQAGASTAAGVSTAGYTAAGREEYRQPPVTVELRATLRGAGSYNILVACDTKKSPAHWELFTMPSSGFLTAFLPGMRPDHVRSQTNICDGKPHDVAMIYEPQRMRLFVDGKQVADAELKTAAGKSAAPPPAPAPSGLAFGRLVEGGLGCDGSLEFLRLSSSVREITPNGKAAPAAEADTIGLWVFDQPAAAETLDRSKFKNHAQRSAAPGKSNPAAQAAPPPGVHLQAIDPTWRTALVDRAANEAYLGVKVDRDGCVFVGGREGVYVFEPTAALEPGAGGYGPRRDLLRFPPDSIIMGLEFRDRDLYVLAADALYLVPEGRVQRTGLKPQRILWGLPLDLHVSFHCLAWGPDGDLYLTHGDPLLQLGDWNRPDHWGHWTLYSGRDEQPVPFTGQGAVLRVRPDGTQPRVVATGLRGPVGLAFDRSGNLFTNDNDHESRADQYAPAKLLHVAPGVDFGWPRGWMASKSPDRFDLVEPMCPEMGRGVPCDLAWYDHPYLGESARDRLLLCRWDRFAVTAYRPVPRGKSFSAVEETLLTGEHNARPTGIGIGPDGRLLVTCLYMAGNMASPYCTSDLVVVTRSGPQFAPATSKTEPAKESASALKSAPTSPEALDFSDTYARQLAVTRLASEATFDRLGAQLAAPNATQRLLAVLAVGHKLTRPATDFVPPEKLKLLYPQENSFFKRLQHFYGSETPVDPASRGRVGSFTTAQWWNDVERSSEQESGFALLTRATNDSDERVRLQAAYFLSLLKDARSEPIVARTQTDVLVQRLSAGPEYSVQRAWSVGPFADGDDAALARPHPPEQGSVDLTAPYQALSWRPHDIGQVLPPGDGQRSSNYLLFRIASGTRQPALLTNVGGSPARVWQNGTAARDASSEEIGDSKRVLLDLQPGSNDVLVRLQVTRGDKQPRANLSLQVRALSKIEIALPEKLDSALLAERLREAATAGAATALSADFLAVDWPAAAKTGDAVEGRRLFGALGCAKCHAIAPEQKGGGAPSLAEARRRFTAAHLVESVLLPSRQVAEPFRAQTITTEQGQVLSGLVVAETADAIELVLPDAQRRTIRKSEIEARAVTTLSPMPPGLVKTPDELRHLLTYLLSDRPTPP